MSLNKALFLDRDGTIISEHGTYNYLPEHISVPSGVIEPLKRIQELGFRLMVITNQGGIAKGLYTHEHVHTMHKLTATIFSEAGITFDAWLYCPHHPDYSHCLCRKPNSLMIEKLLARFNLNPDECYLAGDADRDVEAGQKAGVHGFKINANSGLEEVLKSISS